MYMPKYFEENDYEEIKEIVANYSLAVVICGNSDDYTINHLPLILEKDVLLGHIAKANSMHEKYLMVKMWHVYFALKMLTFHRIGIQQNKARIGMFQLGTIRQFTCMGKFILTIVCKESWR